MSRSRKDKRRYWGKRRQGQAKGERKAKLRKKQSRQTQRRKGMR